MMFVSPDGYIKSLMVENREVKLKLKLSKHHPSESLYICLIILLENIARCSEESWIKGGIKHQRCNVLYSKMSECEIAVDMEFFMSGVEYIYSEVIIEIIT